MKQMQVNNTDAHSIIIVKKGVDVLSIVPLFHIQQNLKS